MNKKPSLIEQKKMAIRLEQRLQIAWNHAHTLHGVADNSLTSDILTGIESAMSAMDRLKDRNGIQ